MLEFMDYVQHAFYSTSGWNVENSYSNLTATARALLDFPTPRGLQFRLSSLSSPNFATSYGLSNTTFVSGNLTYLFTSLPLHPPSKAQQNPLDHLIRGYRQINHITAPLSTIATISNAPAKPTLLYGRLYLPQSTLEALYLRRISKSSQIKLSCVSSSALKNGGTVLAVHQYDVGKYATEALYSSDGGLLGFRGLYNFGPDIRKGEDNTVISPKVDDIFYGRFSTGAELYYGLLNKSGGMSIGGRFATLPEHKGIPLTATLTLNPLMGNISATYAVKAGKHMSLCSRFDFNAYSYESQLVLGMELWRMKRRVTRYKERSMDAKLGWRLDGDEGRAIELPEEVAGVLKARVDREGRIGVLWEGRVKELLFTLGTNLDMRRRDQPFRSLGLEVQFSS